MQDRIEKMQRRIAVSQREEPADFIIRNAKVADVFSLEWIEGDVVVADGMVIAVDRYGIFKAHEEMDAGGRYVVPGLIDGHIHIESSMLTPSAFAEVLLPHGVTTAVTDPHEIANVAGIDGIRFMIDNAADSPMDIHVMLPSSVPAAPFEHAGAVLSAKDLKPLLREPSVLGLAEVMDYPAVLAGDQGMLSKIVMTQNAGLRIDGHGAGLDRRKVGGYRAAGITTDHECVTAEEAEERIRQGMYVMLREGSAAKNLHALLPAVTPYNARRFLFCTDDKHLDELITEGSIDHAVRLAIQAGMRPLQAIQLATLNAAECHGLTGKGAVAAGFAADLILLDDVETFSVSAVWKDGRKVAENGKMSVEAGERISCPPRICRSVRLPELTAERLAIPLSRDGLVHVMEIIPDQIVTKKLKEKTTVADGYFVPDTVRDHLKLVVAERHQERDTVGLAIVKGFGLASGAVATTIAHDSHNAIALGTNDTDILLALKTLQKLQGGLVVVDKGQVLASMALPVAGLMTETATEEAVAELKKLHEALHQIHPSLDFHLFLTLSFLSLPVIPSLKLTDTGLFDVEAFRHISIEAES